MIRSFKKATLYAALVILVLLFVSLRFIVDFRLDYLWFQSVDYISVFLRTYLWRGLVGLGIFASAFLLSYLNLFITFKRSDQKRFTIRAIAISLFIGVVVAVQAGDVWFMVLQALNQTAFQVTDPQFGFDISFFVFMVPFIKLVYRSLTTWLFLNIAATLLVYLFTGDHQDKRSKEPEIEVEVSQGSGRFQHIDNLNRFNGLAGLKSWPGWRHLSLLVGLFICLQAVNFCLNIFDMMVAQSGIVAGAGAASIRVRLPGNLLMAAFSLLAGLIFAFSARHKIKQSVIILGVYVVLNVLILGALPAAYQQIVVSPNEISRETPYLERSIAYTNRAYGLEDIEEREYPVGDLTLEELEENRDVIENIRLLDQKATLTTYGQQQELRPYYEFADVDVDRYLIDGKPTQVMVAAREMNQAELPAQAQSFNNLLFQYTHGFGLVMSPANRTTATGLPDYYIKDIPPVSRGLQITQPRIYFGERTTNNVIVKTKLPEFDYTDGENNQEYIYEGESGIRMTLLNRMMLAFRDVQYRYLFSSYITSESLYLETRNVRDRAIRIAPFLWYDNDPYIVLTEQGDLVYILDAYTMTNRYPYSQAANDMGYNYIRNSVKVTVNAYTGDISFFIFDEQDPIIQTYAKIYPGLFKTKSEFPQDLLAHIRYPEALFEVQSRMLQDYHMSNPVAFYNREDRWAFAEQILGNERAEQEPYYTISRLPGESKEEFVLLRNFTPNGRQNMIAWLAGRSDGDQYGKLLLYTFSKGSQVPGPMQVESQIDQNPEISGQLTLWGQGGSTLIRGNLLVYPVGEALLYVEPLYMESTQNKFPQLKRIFLYYHDRIIMAESLDQALAAMFPGYGQKQPGQGQEAAGEQEAHPQEQDGGVWEISNEQLNQLLNQLIQLQKQGKEALAKGDWAGYGAAQSALDQVISQLESGLADALPETVGLQTEDIQTDNAEF